MDIDPTVRLEWQQEHRLSRPSLDWVHAHADPFDAHPIATAIAALRALELDPPPS